MLYFYPNKTRQEALDSDDTQHGREWEEVQPLLLGLAQRYRAVERVRIERRVAEAGEGVSPTKPSESLVGREWIAGQMCRLGQRLTSHARRIIKVVTKHPKRGQAGPAGGLGYAGAHDRGTLSSNGHRMRRFGGLARLPETITWPKGLDTGCIPMSLALSPPWSRRVALRPRAAYLPTCS